MFEGGIGILFEDTPRLESGGASALEYDEYDEVVSSPLLLLLSVLLEREEDEVVESVSSDADEPESEFESDEKESS